MVEPEIRLPENFEIDLDETEEEEYEQENDEEEGGDMEGAEPLAIEEIVSETQASPAPNIPMSSDFAPQQFIAPQPISPVLERRPIPEIPQTELETDLQNVQTTQSETAGQEAKAYDAGSDYYTNNYQSSDYPEVQAINPTLNSSFARMQDQPRFNQTDTGWGSPRGQDWEKKYEIKFKETKRDRRRV